MSPTLDTDDVSYDIASIQSQYDELKNLEANLISDSAYEELVNNSVFMDYWNTFENANLSDKKATNINAETFIDDLKAYISDKIRAKGYKKLETTEEKIKYFSDFIDANTDTLRNLVALLNKASDVKMTLWNSLKNAKQNYSTFYKHREQGYIPANMEGAAFSDQDGNIVKIVDRSSFSNVNRDTNYLSGFEHEGLDMNIRKIKNESKSYNGYKIRQDHRYGGFNIYDKNGELEDSGFKSEEDAMNEIDKICNDKQLKEGNTLDKNAIAKEFNIKPNTVKCFYCKFWGANMKGGVSTRTGAKCSKLKKVTVANQHCKDFSPDMTRISQKKSGLEEEVDPVFKDFVFAVEQCLRQSFYKLPPIHEIQWADSVEIPFDYDRKQWIPSSASIKKFLKDKYGLNVKVSRMTSNWAYEKEIIMTIKLIRDEAIKEDTVKTSDGKWTNKGDEGTHGKFKTKKEADAQRKAMFANGYHEELDTEELDAFEEEFNESMNIIREYDNKFSSVITEADTELWDYFNKATEEFRQEINSLKKKLSRCKDYYAGMAEAMTNGDITNTDTIDALMAWYNHSDLSVSEVLAKAK
ncbi:MAG: hypothetical protein IJH34_02585 [Romboutsia sp.]|nr:hypothetical protein [Romboutsia sp.]